MDLKERYPCVIGTAGHIDHGKTTLVAALTGTDTDRLPEEKRRGMSIDLGFAALELKGDGTAVMAGLVDVPGHERFIKNMLAGATGMDVALFCVAADDGIMPQTREHFEIIRLLGVRECVFAVTKADCVTNERMDAVKTAIAGLIAPTGLAASPIIPVSAKTGPGMDKLKEALWHAALRSRRPDSIYEDPFRLPIDRSFHVKGFGTVVTGTVASGSIKKGAELLCYPSGAIVKVRGMESLHSAIDEARAGQRTALNITTPPDTDTGRGVMLVSPELKPFIEAALNTPIYAECAFEFIRDVDLKNGRKTFKGHHLTAESVVTIRLASGSAGCGRLTMRPPLLALRGDRVILRDTGRNETVGAAVVKAAWLNKKTMPRRPLPPLAKGGWGGFDRLPPLTKGGRGGFNKLPTLAEGDRAGSEPLQLLHSILETRNGIRLTEAALIFNMREQA
ncbi:MAG: selenocysteine-specific translation elongation factor, partial [Deltaproteobacteria bacterium]|nr:selenocysteine-specific translation elongation factor [Deltaproteobacteria bacterium]